MANITTCFHFIPIHFGSILLILHDLILYNCYWSIIVFDLLNLDCLLIIIDHFEMTTPIVAVNVHLL